MSSKYFAFKVHIIPGQYIREYPGATLDSQEDVLKVHIKQYTPLEHMESQQKGMTIIGGHANGFPKVSILRRDMSYQYLMTIGAVRAPLGRIVSPS